MNFLDTNGPFFSFYYRLTQSGAYDNLKRVNQGHKDDTTSVKARESSHEYD